MTNLLMLIFFLDQLTLFFSFRPPTRHINDTIFVLVFIGHAA